MPPRFPARIHALLARDAPAGVIIRRGPAETTATIGWHRETDEFTPGQWLRGRIYERRGDISPDGRHMIYFARGGRRHAETGGTWTAISRVPWLKAIVLYGKGDTWQGGGLFLANDRYWLNGCHFLVRDDAQLDADGGFRPQGGVGAECLSVYYPRLLRSGWRLVTRLEEGRWSHCTVFEKDAPCGWTLRKFAYASTERAPGRGCYWDEHELEKDGRRIACPAWEWADVDGARLVWSESGCLHAAGANATGLVDQRVLLDCNSMEFEAREAPY